MTSLIKITFQEGSDSDLCKNKMLRVEWRPIVYTVESSRCVELCFVVEDRDSWHISRLQLNIEMMFEMNVHV